MTFPEQTDTDPRFATRLDDWIQAKRSRRAVSRGKKPSVIPYIGYGSTEWVRVLGRVLYLKPEARERTRLRPDVAAVSRVRGWRTYTSVSVARHTVQVLIDGEQVSEVTADRGGVIDAIVPATLTPGWHTVTLKTSDDEAVDSPVNIIDPEAGFGIISDVDDTVLTTALPKPLVAAWNTFVLDENARSATPGMAVMLNQLLDAHEGSPIVYLSTGAWNAAPALSRFLARNLFPMGPLLLTDWGPTHDRWFRSGREHKRRELRRLANEFPSIRWLLIGDDGQHDESLYQEFATEHPRNVAAVAIRQLSVGEAVLAGGRSKARLHRTESGVPWAYGPNGATLLNEAKQLGLL